MVYFVHIVLTILMSVHFEEKVESDIQSIKINKLV